jgi:1-acyl-sn-glycerol-3-phosphate acyltransferase
MKQLFSRLRSYCFFVPLIFLYTGVIGAMALVVSLFDSSGRRQHEFARLWSRLILWTFGSPAKVEGFDRVDVNRPHLYVMNHISAVDIPLIYAHLPFQFRIMAKKELFRYPFLGWYLRRAGEIPIDPSNALHSMRSLKLGIEALRGGMPLVIFPEGGRSLDGKVAPFLPGAFYVAIKAQVEIIPVAIVGTFEMLPMNSFHAHPRPLEMMAGAPISTSGYTVRQMDKLAALAQTAVEDLYYSHAAIADPRAANQIAVNDKLETAT